MFGGGCPETKAQEITGAKDSPFVGSGLDPGRENKGWQE